MENSRITPGLVAVAAAVSATSTLLGLKVAGWRETTALLLAGFSMLLLVWLVFVTPALRFWRTRRMALRIDAEFVDNTLLLIVTNEGAKAEFRASVREFASDRNGVLPTKMWDVRWGDRPGGPTELAVAVARGSFAKLLLARFSGGESSAPSISFFSPNTTWVLGKERVDAAELRGRSCELTLRITRDEPAMSRQYRAHIEISQDMALEWSLRQHRRRLPYIKASPKPESEAVPLF